MDLLVLFLCISSEPADGDIGSLSDDLSRSYLYTLCGSQSSDCMIYVHIVYTHIYTWSPQETQLQCNRYAPMMPTTQTPYSDDLHPVCGHGPKLLFPKKRDS